MEYSEFVEVLKSDVNMCKTSVWENWLEDNIKECKNDDSAFVREAYITGWLDGIKEFLGRNQRFFVTNLNSGNNFRMDGASTHFFSQDFQGIKLRIFNRLFLNFNELCLYFLIAWWCLDLH
jgi:hypothetical protein